MSRSNPYKHKPRTTRHTTLIVVEGETEKAFVEHIKSLFARDCGTRITIESAYGGSGDCILSRAIKMCCGYDKRAVLYDADRPPTKKGILQKSHQLRVQHLVSTPAIEGTFLAILNQTIPRTTAECKSVLKQHIRTSLTVSTTFDRHFPESLLRSRAVAVSSLRELMEALGIRL